jgi:hypothetical protein
LTGKADQTTIGTRDISINTLGGIPCQAGGLKMAQVFVTCKTEGCGAEVLAPESVQVPEDQIQALLHKKNYYLCNKCGKVGAYTKEDHHFA